MRTFKTLTLLLLGLLIFGSAGYFGYQLFIKPGRLEKKEKAAAIAATPTPTPDPGAHELQHLKSLRTSGDSVGARDGLKAWIDSHPESPLLKEARQELGSANLSLLFQPSGNTEVITYTVVKGDSLAKIASKQKSNAELIQKANSLSGINLQIGQQLVIPSLKSSLELDRKAKNLTLLDNGIFVKEYSLLSSPQAPMKTVPAVNTKILEKIANAENKRVAFGDKAYAQSERIILLAGNSSIVGFDIPAQSPQSTTPSAQTGTNTSPSPAPSSLPLPGGYVLSKEDLLEIFPLVSRNTPVIIH
ncbi:MAG: LysM peptidoglycan-binding domain-containing protein [Verrucomicrobia bacterium]|nr:LysM peptidoglycan-binding domain-containing protein [Verrucomicrobiota bacterium]